MTCYIVAPTASSAQVTAWSALPHSEAAGFTHPEQNQVNPVGLSVIGDHNKTTLEVFGTPQKRLA